MNHKVDRLLLGDNPFIGVNHLSQEKSREKTELNSERIARVIDSSLAAGAQGVVCSAHPKMRGALEYMRQQEYPKDFRIYLIVPDAQSYVRVASERGILGLLNESFGKLSLKGKARGLVGGGLSALTSNPTRTMKTYLDAEVSRFGKSLPKNVTTRSVFLHELLTELMISFNLKDLAKDYIDFLKDSQRVIPGFVTRNFARFVDFAIEAELPMDEIVVLAPFNSVGFQMNPTRKECEKRLTEHQDLAVIAMSVLAGGYIRVDEAIDYLSHLRRNISCVIGVSTENHAKETFPKFKSALCQS